MPGPLTYMGYSWMFLFLIAGLGVCIFQASLSTTP